MTTFEMKKEIIKILAAEANKPVAYTVDEFLKQLEDAKPGEIIYFIDEKLPPVHFVKSDWYKGKNELINAFFENQRHKQLSFIYASGGYGDGKMKKVTSP